MFKPRQYVSFSLARTVFQSRPSPLAEAPEPPEYFRTVGDAEVMKYWLGGPDKMPKQTGGNI